MATNVLSIPENIYTSIQNYVIDTYRELYPAGLIPIENVNDSYIHRIPYFGDQDVSKGVLDWDADQARADKVLNYLDVPIVGKQMKLAFTSRDLRMQGDAIINAKIQAIISKFLDEVDYAVWHGNVEGNVSLSTGILSQSTDASHMNIAGSDSVLDSAAELLNALQTMVSKVPVKYRGAQLVLMMNWGFYDKIATNLIGTDTATTVIQVFKAAYPNVHIVKNSAAVLASTDTEAANARMLIFPQDINVLRIVKAKEVSPVGPALVDLTGSVEQLWGTLFAPKIIKTEAVFYTDTTITYS